MRFDTLAHTQKSALSTIVVENSLEFPESENDPRDTETPPE